MEKGLVPVCNEEVLVDGIANAGDQLIVGAIALPLLVVAGDNYLLGWVLLTRWRDAMQQPGFKYAGIAL